MTTKPLTPEQVADHYGVSTDTVWDWIKQNILEAIDISKGAGKKARYRITERAMRRFERKRSTAPQQAVQPKRRRREVVENIV